MSAKRIKELKATIKELEKEYKDHYYDNDADMYLDSISKEKSKAKKELDRLTRKNNNDLKYSKKAFKKGAMLESYSGVKRNKKLFGAFRLKMSNKAHERLLKKHNEIYGRKTVNGGGKGDNWIKGNYHSAVLEQQKRLGRKLNQQEKKDVFKTTSYHYYN